MTARFFFAAILLLLPLYAGAQTEITEIMYDLPGADGDREWVEIYNSGREAVTVVGGSSNDAWRLYEVHSTATHNHTLDAQAFQGSMTIGPGGYAVIAQNGDSFKKDNPDYTGTILVSSAFSLGNTGQTLGLKIGSSGTPWSEVAYASSSGAQGDGNSLQKINGSWVSAMPSPGAGANETSTASSTSGTGSGEEQHEPSQSSGSQAPSSGTSIFEPLQTIVTHIQKHASVVVAGAATEFEGLVLGLKGESIPNARYLWSFGDGGMGEGKKVLHTFFYPGEYVVALEGSSDGYSQSDRITIQAISAAITLKTVGVPPLLRVELLNNSSNEIDLSGWILWNGSEQFAFPKNTFLPKGKTGIFPWDILGWKNTGMASIRLLYPNGKAVALGDEKIENNFAQEVAGKVAVPAPPRLALSQKSISTRKESLHAEIAKDGGREEAALGDSSAPAQGEITKWLMVFLAIILISSGGLFVVFRGSLRAKLFSAKDSADGFTIIEEKL